MKTQSQKPFYKIFIRHYLDLAGHLAKTTRYVLAFVLGLSVETAEYVFDDQAKLVYLVNSKVACTSIKKSLADTFLNVRIADEHAVHHSSAISSMITRKYQPRFDDYYFFTYVRNPFERLVSAYVNKFRDFERIRRTGFEMEHYLGGIFDLDDSFEEFAEKVARIPDRLSDRHFMEQHHLIASMAGRKPDFIGRLEDINTSWPQIQQRFSLKDIPHYNRTSKYDYRDYYTSRRLVELVRQRYKRDIDNYGYEDVYDELMSRLDSRPSVAMG